MKPRLYRIILPVSDIEKADKFYSEIFEIAGTRVSPGRHYFNLEGTILACYDPVADGDKKGDWKFHENQYIYISVPDLEMIHRRLKNMDCSIGEIASMPWGERLFYAKDPFKNPICFVDSSTIFTG